MLHFYFSILLVYFELCRVTHTHTGKGMSVCTSPLHVFFDLGDTLLQKKRSGKLGDVVQADVSGMVEHLRAENIRVSVWSAKKRSNVMRAIEDEGLTHIFGEADVRAQEDCTPIGGTDHLFAKKFNKVESHNWRVSMNGDDPEVECDGIVRKL